MKAIEPRGWCPTALRPMATGDGLLVRVHPRAATLSAAQLRVIAQGASLHGNGLVDLSARGNVQIRGVHPDRHPPLIDALAAAGLLECELRHRRPPAVIVPPLTGIDPDERVDSAALAERIEAALAGKDVADLPAKFAVVIDGGLLSLVDIEADVRLLATGPREDARLAVALAALDGPERIGFCRIEDGPVVVHAIAAAFVRWRRDSKTPVRRVRDVPAATRAAMAGSVAGWLAPGAPGPGTPSCREPAPIGRLRISESLHVAAFAAPFGRLDARLLHAVADWSETLGAGEARVSPWRSLLIVCADEDAAEACLAGAREAGLIADPCDARLAVAACPGAPSCASATTPTQADALHLAEAARLPDRVSVHVSGCAKGCAHPAPADVTLVGAQGGYEVVLRDTARGEPVARVTIDAAAAVLRELTQDGPLGAIPLPRLRQAFGKASRP